jgi:hypothetical protein
MRRASTLEAQVPPAATPTPWIGPPPEGRGKAGGSQTPSTRLMTFPRRSPRFGVGRGGAIRRCARSARLAETRLNPSLIALGRAEGRSVSLLPKRLPRHRGRPARISPAAPACATVPEPIQVSDGAL